MVSMQVLVNLLQRSNNSCIPEFSDPDNRLVVTYENGTPIQDTLLSIQLMELDVQNHFQHQFRDTKRVLKALGSSASNLFWRHWMESTEKDLHMHTKTAMLKLIESWTFDMPSLSSSYSSSNVSPQFTKLAKILQSFEPHGADFRGIIVVERRSVAVMMAELLCYVDETSDFIRAVAVTSSKTLDSNSGKKLLGQFISGELNLLIVTEHVKVLHVGRPSVLIWYDLVDDPPRFCYQSQPGERRYYVIHLAETANEKHRIRLSLQDNVPLKDEDFDILFGKCREESNGSSTSSEDTDDDETTFIQDPITGKRLGPRDAKKALIRFLQEYHDDKNHRPIITLSEDSTGRYLCRVDLPSSLELGVISVWGTPQPSATQAEREACFIACQALYERGLFDYEFFPPTHDSFQDDYIKEGGNLSAIAASGMRRYERAVPLCWSTTVSAKTNKLYPLLVTLASWLSPVLILTRFPLPEIPCFSVFSSADYHYSVRCLRCAPVVINEEQLGLLHRYTLRLARALTNRELVFSTHELLYFFSPVCNTSVKMEELPENKWSRPDISSRIDWNAIKLAAEQLFTPLVQEGSNLDEALIDAVIQDRWVEFTNRYNLVGIRSDLTPLSKNPESPDEPSFMEFCKTRRKNFDGLKDESQPMIEASIIPPLVDLLNPIPKPYRDRAEVTDKVNFRTAQFLPSITHRLSDILLAKQLNDNFFENRISQHHLFEALFPPSAETESSYERLELLGKQYTLFMFSPFP
ncbi:hypothetical protein QCA50_001305 [Cerrena zonata]|uniref:Uncharacterized protein n=1 Tax=Cerrena zonata TaxID=2478898 RepID=A0AAW0GWE4_9APHY